MTEFVIAARFTQVDRALLDNRLDLFRRQTRCGGQNQRSQSRAVGCSQAGTIDGPVLVMCRGEGAENTDPRRGDVYKAARARKPGVAVFSVRGTDSNDALMSGRIGDRIALLKQIASRRKNENSLIGGVVDRALHSE